MNQDHEESQKKQERKPKTYRYRRDLTAYYFALRHDFRKGLRKIMPEPVYIGDMPDYLFLPHWQKINPGQYSFLKLKHRTEQITVFSNRDVKRACNYIRQEKTDILDCLFDMTALCVLSASIEGETPGYTARFRFENISCYGFVTRLI